MEKRAVPFGNWVMVRMPVLLLTFRVWNKASGGISSSLPIMPEA